MPGDDDDDDDAGNDDDSGGAREQRRRDQCAQRRREALERAVQRKEKLAKTASAGADVPATRYFEAELTLRRAREALAAHDVLDGVGEIMHAGET